MGKLHWKEGSAGVRMNEIQENIRTITEVYYHDPYGFVTDIIGVEPTPQQRVVLQAVAEGERFIAVKSGHGVGKTSLEAWLIIWFLSTRPYPRIPSTAPTEKTLLTVLWPEIFKWLKNSKVGYLFDWTKTGVSLRGGGENWFAVARSSNKPENMQGFHAEHLMFIIEEASGVPQPIMEVVEGTLTTKNIYCFMFSNPTQLSGTFYEAFHRQKQFWKQFTFNSETSPIVTKEYCERMAAKFGKESDIYRIRVLGEFPRGEADTIFSIDEIDRAMKRELPNPSVDKVFIGVDVARFGDNKTVIATRRGLKVEIYKKFYKQDTMATTGEIVNLVKSLENKGISVQVNVDDTGVGGGVTDRLGEVQSEGNFSASVLPVNNGSKALDDEHYENKGTEMWMRLKEMIDDVQLPDDEDLLGELTTRKKVMTSKGKIRLERKEDLRKRDLASPDTADAVVLTFEEGQNFTYLHGGEGVIF